MEGIRIPPGVELYCHLAAGDAIPRFAPQARPLLGVGEHLLGAGGAPSREPGESRAAGRLADRLIAQVEAPADVLALVVERPVLGHLVEQDRTPGADFESRDPVPVDD